MTRSSFIRSIVLAAIAAAFVMLAPRTIHAQDAAICHGCDHITISNETNCKVTLCFSNPLLAFCRDFAPGSVSAIPCNGITRADIRDCTGNLHQITKDCVHLGVTGGCCVRACLELDAAGCIVIRITPSPILCICA